MCCVYVAESSHTHPVQFRLNSSARAPCNEIEHNMLQQEWFFPCLWSSSYRAAFTRDHFSNAIQTLKSIRPCRTLGGRSGWESYCISCCGHTMISQIILLGSGTVEDGAYKECCLMQSCQRDFQAQIWGKNSELSRHPNLQPGRHSVLHQGPDLHASSWQILGSWFRPSIERCQ